MRVTNNMITSNTKSNINANKVLVDKYNTQMTTQKKINKPSDDPVIAIRSLRMQTSLSHIDQYLNNNISDANSWLNVTDTALENMKTILTDVRSLCVKGATDTLKEDDRRTILNQLKSLSDQIYAEGNADFSGRTVFTGYRTTEQLTFKTDEETTSYTIDQKLSYKDISEARYTYGNVDVPTDAAKSFDETISIGENTYDRLRLAYGKINGKDNSDGTGAIDPISSMSYTTAAGNKVELNLAPGQTSGQFVDENGAATGSTFTMYESKEEWLKANNGEAKVGDKDMVFIKDTGEMIANSDLKGYKHNISLSFRSSPFGSGSHTHSTKTGFDAGEVRPEYYYDCKMKTPDMQEAVQYTKEDQPINFEISSGIMLAANTQASDVLSTDIGRDMTEMMTLVSASTQAHDKVSQIEKMMSMDKYSDEESQKKLQTYLDAANKEATYADDNLSKTYQQFISNFDGYLNKVNVAHTNVGGLQQRVELTKTRVENQKETVEELKSNNDNRDISDIIIDYYAAYNAYTSSLTAASKVGSQTLLNYL